MGHDITARRQAELDRIQLERQLLHSQKMETIGTLAAGVAHEFNNILATIIGNTEMALLLHPEDQSHRECHDAVLQSSGRARDLVQRILALSRRSEPERRPVQLARIVAEASSLIRATLPSTVELVTECSAGAPDALADLNELHQVLLNLAANAAYAMREKGGRLTLRTFFAEFADSHPCALTTLPAGAYVALEVADTGRGIEARHLPKIFDPFYTTKPVGEGSGLGLAIVQNIVARHGGAIEVASTPGAGAVFTLYFPVATGGIPARVRTDAAPRPLGLARGQGERVAVIDDEEPIAIVIEAALRQLNYAPRRFSSADEFYAEFVAGRFAADLVVTDQTMPRLTGLQLARKLRAEGHAIPLVIMSGYNPQSAPESAVEGGRVAHLEKPFDLNQLAATVQYLLRPTGPR
jgi:nitrogen-specific signal transduction histidine kinase/CheY-like chemotaxis protein